MLLKVALNGPRRAGSHPALPVTPQQAAAESRAAVAAGAGAIHVHVRDREGAESLHPADVASFVDALLASGIDVPIGISTGAWVEPDPERRLALVREWTVLPDFASVNYDEEGSDRLGDLLVERGVGVEAAAWSVRAAERLVQSGIAQHCLRVLVEPLEQDEAAALRMADEIESVLDRASISAPRLLHGVGAPVWSLIAAAAARGHASRIGLEDTFTLPDGRMAAGNAELISAAVEIARRAYPPGGSPG